MRSTKRAYFLHCASHLERNLHCLACRLLNRKAITRPYYKRDPEARVAAQIKSARKNPSRVLWNNAKQRAKRYGLEFTIAPEDIIIPAFCPVFEKPFSPIWQPRGSKDLFVPSLDRIVPSLGYVPGNIKVISLLANMMKSAATPEQLLKFAAAVQTGIL